jgi:septum formation protein
MINDKRSMIQLPPLVLASGSPRRAEILMSVGWTFEKRVADIDESEFENEKPEDYVQRLAREKAEKVAASFTNALVLGADTIVVIENQIIGKPKDAADARRMLKMLAGNWHEVFTGVALVKVSESKTETEVALQKTRVKFAEL